jgi:hypothetical protein
MKAFVKQAIYSDEYDVCFLVQQRAVDLILTDVEISPWGI